MSDNSQDPATPDSVPISEAIEFVLKGARAKQVKWPAGDFIFLVPGSTFEVNRAPLLGIYPEGTAITYHAHIDKCENSVVAPWTPSQRDWFTAWVLLPDKAS